MDQSFEMNPQALAIASAFMATRDVRTYLNGVHISSFEGGTLFQATNGLGAIQVFDPKTTYDREQEIIRPSARLVTACKRPTARRVHFANYPEVEDASGYEVPDFVALVTGHNYTNATRYSNSFTARNIGFDGFPVLETVMPESWTTEPGMPDSKCGLRNDNLQRLNNATQIADGVMYGRWLKKGQAHPRFAFSILPRNHLKIRGVIMNFNQDEPAWELTKEN